MALLVIVLVFILIEALLSLAVVRFGWSAYRCLMIHAVLYGVTFAVVGFSVTIV
jgi:hypothetical protein